MCLPIPSCGFQQIRESLQTRVLVPIASGKYVEADMEMVCQVLHRLQHFTWILEYLRNEEACLPSSELQVAQLQLEAEFLQASSFGKVCMLCIPIIVMSLSNKTSEVPARSVAIAAPALPSQGAQYMVLSPAALPN